MGAPNIEVTLGTVYPVQFIAPGPGVESGGYNEFVIINPVIVVKCCCAQNTKISTNVFGVVC